MRPSDGEGGEVRCERLALPERKGMGGTPGCAAETSPRCSFRILSWDGVFSVFNSARVLTVSRVVSQVLPSEGSFHLGFHAPLVDSLFLL